MAVAAGGLCRQLAARGGTSHFRGNWHWLDEFPGQDWGMVYG